MSSALGFEILLCKTCSNLNKFRQIVSVCTHLHLSYSLTNKSCYTFVYLSDITHNAGIADFADSNRKLLSSVNAILLSLVPWIQVSRSRSLLLMVKPTVFLVAVLMGALLHLTLLGFNALSIQILRAASGGSKSVFAKKENSSALLLVASQKTLPVLVAVVDQLGGTYGESGLLVLPCVAAHLNQIIMDSFFVSFLNKKRSLGNAEAS